MRIINHSGAQIGSFDIDSFPLWMDNRNEPIVRCGGDVYGSIFDPECSVECYVADPRRSFARQIYNVIDQYPFGSENWPLVDFLVTLLVDLGFDLERPSFGQQVAFWTMFPFGVSQHIATSYMKICGFNDNHRKVSRVVNNPFFRCDTNVPETCLLEICEHADLCFAVDMREEIPPAVEVANEIAMLCHIHEGSEVTEAARKEIVERLFEVGLWNDDISSVKQHQRSPLEGDFDKELEFQKKGEL